MRQHYEQSVDAAGVLPVTRNFVPAASRPEVVQLPAAVPLQSADLSRAWQATTSPSRDSVSAQDRAKAHLLRSIPVFVTVFLLSGAVTVLYAIVAMVAGVGVAGGLDRLFVFLFALAAMGFVAYGQESKREYEHSHAGVERLRVTAAVEIRQAEISAELQLRTAALSAQLRLLGVDDDAK